MMKKILFILSTLITMLFFTETINATNPTSSQSQVNKYSENDFYVFHRVNKTSIDRNSVKYTVLGYRYLKDPIPYGNHRARFLLIKCQVNTDDLDSGLSPTIDNSFIKVYDNQVEASEASDELSKKRMKRSPFKHVYSYFTDITAKPGKTYEIDTCVIVYPYNDIEIQFGPEYDDKQVITIHKVESSNGITMNDNDPLKNYDKEKKTDASNN